MSSKHLTASKELEQEANKQPYEVTLQKLKDLGN